MLKNFLIGISSILLILLFGAIFYSAYQPKPFRWNENYSISNKQPFGTYILHNQLKGFFPDQTIKRAREEDFYDYYIDEIFDMDEYDENGEYIASTDSVPYYERLSDTQNFNFLVVNNSLNLNNTLSKALLLHLYQGNHALIAAYETNELLLKMLEIELASEYLVEEDPLADTTGVTISMSDDTKVELRVNDTYNVINKYPHGSEVLLRSNKDEVIAVKVNIGEGSLTLCTAPIMFTNYYLLNRDRTVVESLLLDLPERDTYWANYLVGRQSYNEQRSILDFIHSEPALKWAFYTLLVGVLIYLAFQLRRKERAVPTIKPPANLSLRFIEAVSSLFFLHKNNKELIRKKMNYFLEMVREKYRLDTQNIDEKFIERLSKKAGVQTSLLNHIFRLYDEYLSKQEVSDEDFLRFNKLMQTFKLE